MWNFIQRPAFNVQPLCWPTSSLGCWNLVSTGTAFTCLIATGRYTCSSKLFGIKATIPTYPHSYRCQLNLVPYGYMHIRALRFKCPSKGSHLQSHTNHIHPLWLHKFRYWVCRSLYNKEEEANVLSAITQHLSTWG